MSKAFTREESDGPDLPDLRPTVSTLPEGARNYMTAAGAHRLRDELAQLANEKRPPLAAATDDPEAKRQLAVLDRRIRQLEQSLQSAEIVPRPESTPTRCASARQLQCASVVAKNQPIGSWARMKPSSSAAG